MRTYFDRREGREKPIPDCARVGLTWDAQTQRCERKSLIDRVMNTLNPTNEIAMSEYEDYGCADPDGAGLGFLPGAVAVGSAAGPIGTVVGVVVGVVGTLFSKIFGGGDDQATKYRPPADAATKFVQFDDALSSEYIAFDMGPASLAAAQARGNRVEDIYSYYSAFITNSTNAGASPAARRVIEDAARTNGVSISRAAEIILTVAGVTRIAQSFLPGQGAQQPGSGSAPTGLPPYCPVGSYHPFPIGHPQQDLCIPFPEWMQGDKQGDKQKQPTQQPSSRPGATQPQSRLPGVPAGYWYNPATGQIEPIPRCTTPGAVFDQRAGKCLTPAQIAANEQGGSETSDWMLWALLAGVVFLAVTDKPSGGKSR